MNLQIISDISIFSTDITSDVHC